LKTFVTYLSYLVKLLALLLVSQRVDGIQTGSFLGGIKTEKDVDGAGEEKGDATIGGWRIRLSWQTLWEFSYHSVSAQPFSSFG